ncbi:23S rRNA (uracil-5-)-methyltransferase 1 [Thermococcus cleftensis]|uniref:23S rRNA (Uracil-5-)-methyltransferase 1 n=1 Tax=Thermococcus cleftensis (strain DSM 27260 / KACC 17922 / CL1) TaxID=163003 RepID=I3ZUM1_THECF|nr:23S rRNA (uracil(1939)-C(5))-methyltransferase RlmD [Thermococcus cleftensis]AFL95405.1 23S rRNA (uracil-5-)-methyltransferase 1 [Thermococcus cleftensis]
MRGVVERLDLEGLGVVRDGRREVHVPFTAPGDVVEVKKWRRKKRTLIATDFEVVEPSPERTEPVCPYFGVCGGCLLQHIPYERQVEFKEEKLSTLLGMDIKVIPSPVIYGHRNRIDVVISTRGIGFRRRGTWWDAVDIEHCPVFGEVSGRILRSLREFIEDSKPSLYEIRRNEGFLRYIVIREGKFTGELMVNLVTSEGSLPERFPEYFDYADSIYWSVNRTQSDVSYGEIERFWKAEFIRERLDDVTYLIHPNSFFQTNSYQAVTLVRKVAELVDGDSVLDLYSGVGTFGVYLAKRGFKVEGIEVNPFAVEMANKNAELNGVEASFMVGEDRDVESLARYDTVIVDPPRAGLHPKLIRKILKDKPPSIVYVSCNPGTLAQNLEVLGEKYAVESAIGIDMFPHTPHVETVVKLKLKV